MINLEKVLYIKEDWDNKSFTFVFSERVQVTKTLDELVNSEMEILCFNKSNNFLETDKFKLFEKPNNYEPKTAGEGLYINLLQSIIGIESELES